MQIGAQGRVKNHFLDAHVDHQIVADLFDQIAPILLLIGCVHFRDRAKKLAGLQCVILQKK